MTINFDLNQIKMSSIAAEKKTMSTEVTAAPSDYKAQHPLFQMTEAHVYSVSPTYETFMRRVTSANINDTHVLKDGEHELVGTPLMLAVYKEDGTQVERLLRDFNPNIDKEVEQIERESWGAPKTKKALEIAIAAAEDGSVDATAIINTLVRAGANHDIYDVIKVIGLKTPLLAIIYLNRNIDNYNKRYGALGFRYNVLEHAVSARRLDIFNTLVNKVDLNDTCQIRIGLLGVDGPSQLDKPVIWMLAAYWLNDPTFYYSIDNGELGSKQLDLIELQEQVQKALRLAEVEATGDWPQAQYAIVPTTTDPIVESKIYTDFYGALLRVQSSEQLRALLVALDEKIESTFQYLTVPTTTDYK
jgi:hypothetical protein